MTTIWVGSRSSGGAGLLIQLLEGATPSRLAR